MALSVEKFDCSRGIINILYNKNNLLVRTSTIKDMLLIDKLQKENCKAVGFIQKSIWEKYVFGGQRNFFVLICEANADAVGYILITPGITTGRYAKIQQIAVRNDARRLHYGSALLSVGKSFCEEFGRRGFTLRCRKDLESNVFWKNLGFRQYGTWEKGKINHVGFKASNDINLWCIDLNKNMPDMFQKEIDEDLLNQKGE